MATQDLGKIQGIDRGEYSGLTPFEPLDTCAYNGTTYYCTANSTGNLPTNTSFFRPLIDLTAYNILAVTAYVVSQYANGDASRVATISAGLAVADYDYFVYEPDLRVYAKDDAVGSFDDPLDFDPDTGIDGGFTSGSLYNASAGNKNKSITITMTDATYTLSASEVFFGRIEIGGTLTSEQELVVGADERLLAVKNNTDYPIKVVSVASGSGVHVPVGEAYSLRIESGVVVTDGICNGVTLKVATPDSSGTFTYPYNLTQDDFEEILFNSTLSTSPQRQRGSEILRKQRIDEYPTNWEVQNIASSSTTTVSITASHLSTTSFSLSGGTGDGAFSSITATLKDGVSH